MDVREYNKRAWDRLVEQENVWTKPVSAEEIKRARNGEWSLVLTPSKPVPQSWYPALKGCKVLCLAGAGRQQGPILAAAGADVTVYDNSPKQLGQDRLVAEREKLTLKTVEGDMRDLKAFKDESFDFIFHPCSNCFVDSVRPVWREAYRVLRKGGTMISGFSNPVNYLFDPDQEREGVLQLKFPMLYSDLHSLDAADRERLYGPDEPLNFAHTLEDQLGGQMDAGFHLVGFYEDDWGGKLPIDKFLKVFIATRALKP